MNATDIETLRAFYVGHRQLLFTYALSLTADRSAAEDALHSAFQHPADGILAYDLVTHTSTALPDGFIGVSQAAAVTLGDAIYVVGGLDRAQGDAMDLIQVFALRAPAP